MAKTQKAPPILPKAELSVEGRPLNVSDKYNWRYQDGDWITEMLDKDGLPIGTPIIPDKAKK